MLRLIYERLEEVVEKKRDQRVEAAAAGLGSILNTPYVMDRPITRVLTSLPPLLQHQLSAPIPTGIPLSLSAPPTAAPASLVQPPPLSRAQPLPIVGTSSLSLITPT
ncbi:hypothetical protein F3Y22_tig00110174pilonHSYRG00153 [Hibiscus syriacus]|uniref:Uncharacterized protein n=1 Tax=Hibiscus syriacus TaxID=106335 RepID=A0A6A3BJY4_HIBSY|nr:hypothetical protein F3Y22_tig00110174pilonHSYRG00153 [Hibiscus syriacus]